MRKWPEDDATTEEVAQLALLRLLWLQRECHRAGRRDEVEAAAQLARTALETLIVGLWLLHVPEPLPRMRRQNARALQSLARFMTGPEFVPPELVDAAIRAVGEPIGPAPIGSLAAQIESAGGGHLAVQLYENFYQPLSILFCHGSGLTLLRHIDSRDHVAARPSMPWTRRSAVHLADACVGLLAAALAEQTNGERAVFVQYADAHRDRLLAPGFVAAMKGGYRTVRWSRLPAVVPAIREMRRIVSGYEAMRDNPSSPDAADRIDQMTADLQRLATSVLGELLVGAEPGLIETMAQALVEQVLPQQAS